jgi:hypothetical protein
VAADFYLHWLAEVDIAALRVSHRQMDIWGISQTNGNSVTRSS